jgi:hypothetical protein
VAERAEYRGLFGDLTLVVEHEESCLIDQMNPIGISLARRDPQTGNSWDSHVRWVGLAYMNTDCCWNWLCQVVAPTPVSRYRFSGPHSGTAQFRTVTWALAGEDVAHHSSMGPRLEMACPSDSRYPLSKVTVAFSLQVQDTRLQIPRIAGHEIGRRGKWPKG